MKFILLIFAAALSLEAIGTYVSIFGLSKTFNSDPVIIAMAIVLDFVKIVVVSLLYKYWDRINLTLKSLFLPATFVTMLITSYGVAGYMSNAFQGAIQQTAQIDVQLENFERQRTKLETRKKEMDAQISQMPENFITARQRLMKSFEAELVPLNKKLTKLDDKILELKQTSVTANHDLGPIAFLSEAFGIEVGTAVSILIALVVFVFDPLAVLLLIAGNMLLVDRQKERAFIHEEELELEKEKVLLKKAEIDHAIDDLTHHDGPRSIMTEDLPDEKIEEIVSVKMDEAHEHFNEEFTKPVTIPPFDFMKETSLAPTLYQIQEPEEVYIEEKTEVVPFEQVEQRPEVTGEWVSAVTLSDEEVEDEVTIEATFTDEEPHEVVNVDIEVDETPDSEISVSKAGVILVEKPIEEELHPIAPMTELPQPVLDDEVEEELVIEEPEVEEVKPELQIIEQEDKGHVYQKWTAAVHRPELMEHHEKEHLAEPEPIIDSVSELETYLSDLNEKEELTEEEIADKEKIETYLRRKDEGHDEEFIKSNPLGIDVR